MTNTMNAVAYTKNLPISDDASLEDVLLPLPEVGPKDLLVEVNAVSVNPVDVKVRSGKDPAGIPTVLGYDAAGTVRAVGPEVTLFKAGDDVYYAGAINRGGSNAQFQAVDERLVGGKPKTLNFARAAALPLTSITAWEGLFVKLGLSPESTGTLLMIGGAGGVGSMVIQLVRALIPGLHVIASASRKESQEWVRSLGAHGTVRHGEALREDVQRVAPEGVDYIFTTNSAGQLDAFVEILKPFGQIVAIDDPGHVDVAHLKSKSLTWHWELMFTRSLFQTPDMIEQHHLLNKVASMVDAGIIGSTITHTFHPINAENLRKAHAIVESGHTLGKIVVAAIDAH
ncbi:zinc-binding alcohol dehydrogenase family protein [Arthrobacter sp. MDT3-24]